MNELTHTVTIEVRGKYPHGAGMQHASVTLAGSGNLDHMLDAFKAALVAAGFSTETAARLDVVEGGNG